MNIFTYNEDSADIIMSCTVDGLNIQELDLNDISREGSIWADYKLLNETPRHMLHYLVGNQHLNPEHVLNVLV